VEKHCVWEGGSCKEKKCNTLMTESDCKELAFCFWIKENETPNVNPKCVIQACEKIVFIL
jgi:hypothetical protein